MSGSRHHTNVSTIADALRELADRLDKTPVRDLPPVWLLVSMQSVMWTTGPGLSRTSYTLEERRDAVDTIATHLNLPAPDGEPDSTYGSSSTIGRVDVNVYTGNREVRP